MDFEKKIVAAHEFLESKDIYRGSSVPLLFRIVRLFGVKIAPPHFRGFTSNALTMGAFFCIFWGVGMALLIGLGFLPHKPMPVGRLAILLCMMALLSGVLFGLAMGAYYRHSANKNMIPKWRDFTG